MLPQKESTNLFPEMYQIQTHCAEHYAYVQVAMTILSSRETEDREYKPLEKIDDNIFSNNVFNLYSGSTNYNVNKPVRYGKLYVTDTLKESPNLLKYSK